MAKATAECGDALQALSATEAGVLKEGLISMGTGMHSVAKVAEAGAEALEEGLEVPLKMATRHMKAVGGVMSDRASAWGDVANVKVQTFIPTDPPI